MQSGVRVLEKMETININQLPENARFATEQSWAKDEWVMVRPRGKGYQIITGNDPFERHEYKNSFLLVVRHGGIREGAGRKPPHGQATVRKTIRLTPPEWTELAEINPSPSQAVRILLTHSPTRGRKHKEQTE